MEYYGNNDWRDYQLEREHLAHYGVKGMKWGKSVGSAISGGVNNVLTFVGLKKDPKRKHTRGKAKKRKTGKHTIGHPSYRRQWAMSKMRKFNSQKKTK